MEEFIFWTFELMNPYPEGWGNTHRVGRGHGGSKETEHPSSPK